MRSIRGLPVKIQDAGSVALYSFDVERAVELDWISLRETVKQVYESIYQLCRSHPALHPARCWNFIPAIHGVVHDTLDRYQVFNMGRYDALSTQLGGDNGLDGRLPTATGIGHDADSFSVHCLASSSPPVNLENPRQIPAYRYSMAYGPRPPCFSRASHVSIGGRNVLLVGGTASVLGEMSFHGGKVQAQLDETLENLRSLVVTAGRTQGREICRVRALSMFRHARAYVVNADDSLYVENRLSRLMPNLEDLEVRLAKICRTDLTVEVEGIAALDPW